MIAQTNNAPQTPPRPSRFLRAIPADQAVDSHGVLLHCVREPRLGQVSQRTSQLALNFGLPLFGAPKIVFNPVLLPIDDGQVVLLIGPSGSGKTTALQAIARQLPGAVSMERGTFSADPAIIDGIAPWATVEEAASLLTACGLGEPHLWLRRFEELSDGEKFRARLARALALQSRAGSVGALLCDEFCSALHTRVARAIGCNLRKLVKQRNLRVVLATTRQDLRTALRPHVVVRFDGRGGCAVYRAPQAAGTASFRRRVVIEPGGVRDYRAFAAMHYRQGDELGFVDKVFVLRDGPRGDLLGIVVYAHSPLHLAMRNRALGAQSPRTPQAVNRRFRILRRLVIHPDVRGCGLGHHLVRRTLPHVGTRYVECLAGLGALNPVFEKAGMERIGQYALSSRQQAALRALADAGVDPLGRDFVWQVSRQPRVRAIVARVVYDWYASTTGGGESRVARQSPATLAHLFRGLIGSRPVYYLWRRGEGGKKR